MTLPRLFPRKHWPNEYSELRELKTIKGTGIYLEVFASFYSGFAETINARREGHEPTAIGKNIPLGYDGLKCLSFVDAVVDSAQADTQSWSTPSAA